MEEFLQQWSYLGVFLTIIATGAGLPLPEELPVVIGGAIVGSGNARWWLMLPVSIVAVIIGDGILYGIGRLWGSRLVERPFIKKHILPPERLQKIEDNFQQYGIRILLFARLTPGIRAPIFLTAGIVKLPLIRFLIADGIYAIPGVSILFLLGYAFTDQMISVIKNEFEHVKTIIIFAVVLAVAGYFVYRFLRKPVVTGDPAEMPPLAEPMSHTLDSVSKILQPHEMKMPHASESQSKPTTPEPSPNGQVASQAPAPAERPGEKSP